MGGSPSSDIEFALKHGIYSMGWEAIRHSIEHGALAWLV